MIDRWVTPHFRLFELLRGQPEPGPEVLANLQRTCILLEAVRFHFGLPLFLHSAYRSPERNAKARGAHESDHLTGSAGDFNVAAGHGMTWEANTKAAFEFVRTQLGGRFGQVILEDHRLFLADPEKLWVHLSIPSAKHPGSGDADAVLFSPQPNHYERLLAA